MNNESGNAQETSNESQDDITTSDETQTPDRLTVLKDRARKMGIAFSNNIGADALSARINAKLEGQPDPEEKTETAAPAEELNPLGPNLTAEEQSKAEPEEAPVLVVKKSPRQIQKDAMMKLVRCRITCLNPNKKNLHGEFHAVANELIGTVKKFIPYGEVTDDGFHIPFILFKKLDKQRFVSIRSYKDRKTGHQKVETSMAKEFGLEVLPQLTPAELKKLATAQQAVGSVER